MIFYLPQLLLRCLTLTLLIECALAWLRGLRKPRDLLVVALVNILTNPLLVFLCALVQLTGSRGCYCAVLFLLEVAAFTVEGLIYRSLLPERRPFLLSLLLNAASFGLGVLLNYSVF